MPIGQKQWKIRTVCQFSHRVSQLDVWLLKKMFSFCDLFPEKSTNGKLDFKITLANKFT